jgi:thioredoxin-related protein
MQILTRLRPALFSGTALAALVIALLAFRPSAEAQAQAAPERGEAAAPANTVADGINWMTFEEAMAAMEKEPKKVFIDLYTDWCGWCKKMDANTFSNATVAAYMNEKFYAVKFDAEQQQPVVYKGKEFTFVPSGRRGYNQLAAELAAGRLSYPTTVYLDENSDPIQAIPGYKDAYYMDKILKFFGENHYRTKTWVQFQETYESPLR